MLKLTTSNAMFPAKVKEISCLKKIQKNKTKPSLFYTFILLELRKGIKFPTTETKAKSSPYVLIPRLTLIVTFVNY